MSERRQWRVLVDDDGFLHYGKVASLSSGGILVREVLPGDDDLAAKLAEAEAERAAWQSLDGVNWHERAKNAEHQRDEARRQLAELHNLVIVIDREAGRPLGRNPEHDYGIAKMWKRLLHLATPAREGRQNDG